MKKLLILLTTIIIFPLMINAQDNSIFLGKEKPEVTEYKSGETIEFYVRNDMLTPSITGNLVYDKDIFELTSTDLKEGWKIEGTLDDFTLNFELKRGLEYFNEKVLTFKLKIKSEATGWGEIKLTNLKDSEGKKIDDQTVPIKIKSDAALASLKIEGFEVEPKFDPNAYNYTLKVPASTYELKLNADVGDDKASFVTGFSGNRIVRLTGEKTEVIIKVEHPDGNKEYKINVIRENYQNADDNFLRGIILNYGYLSFDRNQLNYMIDVYSNAKTMEIKPILSNKEATYKIDGPETLVEGANIFNIVVTSLDGDTKKYQVLVNLINLTENQLKSLSDDNLLKELKVNGKTITLKDKEFKYKVSLSDLKDVLVEAKANNEKSNISIQGNENLKSGDIVYIVVTALNGENAVYELTISGDGNVITENIVPILIVGGAVVLVGVVVAIIMKKRKQG